MTLYGRPRRGFGCNLLGQSVVHPREQGRTSSKNDICIQILPDIDVALKRRTCSCSSSGTRREFTFDGVYTTGVVSPS